MNNMIERVNLVATLLYVGHDCLMFFQTVDQAQAHVNSVAEIKGKEGFESDVHIVFVVERPGGVLEIPHIITCIPPGESETETIYDVLYISLPDKSGEYVEFYNLVVREWPRLKEAIVRGQNYT